MCYKYEKNQDFILGTTIQRNNDIIERKLLQPINESTDRLYFRYTMLVRQFTLTEQAYKFLEEVVKSNKSQGTLFDPIPYTLVGNVKCITNKDIPVIGYFLVSGVTEKRIFIDRSELPAEYSPTNGINDCVVHTVYFDDGLTNYRLIPKVDSLLYQGYVVFEKFDPHNPTNPKQRGIHIAKPICFNCTLQGDNKVPDFWTEKKATSVNNGMLLFNEKK